MKLNKSSKILQMVRAELFGHGELNDSDPALCFKKPGIQSAARVLLVFHRVNLITS